MNRALNMLGLCARAGKLISGEKACLQLIRSAGVDAQSSREDTEDAILLTLRIPKAPRKAAEL